MCGHVWPTQRAQVLPHNLQKETSCCPINHPPAHLRFPSWDLSHPGPRPLYVPLSEAEVLLDGGDLRPVRRHLRVSGHLHAVRGRTLLDWAWMERHYHLLLGSVGRYRPVRHRSLCGSRVALVSVWRSSLSKVCASMTFFLLIEENINNLIIM